MVAHAGLKETMQGRASARAPDFALYGETTGETDEFGRPLRCNRAGGRRLISTRLRPNITIRMGIIAGFTQAASRSFAEWF